MPACPSAQHACPSCSSAPSKGPHHDHPQALGRSVPQRASALRAAANHEPHRFGRETAVRDPRGAAFGVRAEAGVGRGRSGAAAGGRVCGDARARGGAGPGDRGTGQGGHRGRGGALPARGRHGDPARRGQPNLDRAAEGAAARQGTDAHAHPGGARRGGAGGRGHHVRAGDRGRCVRPARALRARDGPGGGVVRADGAADGLRLLGRPARRADRRTRPGAARRQGAGAEVRRTARAGVPQERAGGRPRGAVDQRLRELPAQDDPLWVRQLRARGSGGVLDPRARLRSGHDPRHVRRRHRARALQGRDLWRGRAGPQHPQSR